MSIFKDKKCLAEDIFNGRNTEWFDNISGNSWDDVYEFLAIRYGVDEKNVTDEWIKEYTEPDEGDDRCYYYSHCFIKVGDYIDWFRKHNPDLDAGWVTTYEKWAYENKGIVPDEIYHQRSNCEDPDDAHFIIIQKQYDCSRWLFEYLIEHNIPEDAVIQYCFDH